MTVVKFSSGLAARTSEADTGERRGDFILEPRVPPLIQVSGSSQLARIAFPGIGASYARCGGIGQQKCKHDCERLVLDLISDVVLRVTL